jgi:hypothetical protein
MLQERGASRGADIDDEIARYLSYKPQDTDMDDALQFWRTHPEFKFLLPVARYYLSLSASSVPVESMFSITGLILNSKRAALSPANLNFITFVHDNS